MIDYWTGPDPSLSFNYQRLLTFYVLPLAVIPLSLIFWGTKGCISRLSAQERWDKTVATINIIWFLFYPTIVSYLASSLNCTKIEDTPRLYDDLEEICYEGRHLKIVKYVSIPGLILWAFGIPLLGFFLLRRGFAQLDDI